jgi:hypothetical protein
MLRFRCAVHGFGLGVVQLSSLGVVSAHENYNTQMDWSSVHRSAICGRVGAGFVSRLSRNAGVESDAFFRLEHCDSISLLGAFSAFVAGCFYWFHRAWVGVITFA